MCVYSVGWVVFGRVVRVVLPGRFCHDTVQRCTYYYIRVGAFVIHSGYVFVVIISSIMSLGIGVRLKSLTVV